MKVAWGIPYSVARAEEYKKLKGEKEFNLTTTLPSARYSEVEVTLSPAKAEAVKSLTISLTLDTMSLYTPPIK